MKVLLIVDVQRDFCPGGALAVPEGDAVVPLVNSLMKSGKYDLHVATLDWHPTDHVSFADTHPGKALFDTISIEGRTQVLWPRHCVQESLGAAFHPDLETRALHHIVHKGTHSQVDSYSGFFDNARTFETPLRSWLIAQANQRGEAIEDIEIDVVGLALDYCVGLTALDACELGFKTRVILDATRAVNIRADDDQRMLKTIISKGGAIIEAREVLATHDRAAGRSAAAELHP